MFTGLGRGREMEKRRHRERCSPKMALLWFASAFS